MSGGRRHFVDRRPGPARAPTSTEVDASHPGPPPVGSAASQATVGAPAPGPVRFVPAAALLDAYDGPRRHGLPHGHGLLAGGESGHYLGDWDRGLPHGRGRLLLPAATGLRVYEGALRRGEAHGPGCLYTATTRVEGNFWRGHVHGQARTFGADGLLRHRGGYRLGLAHGPGCENLRMGGGYAGDYVDGSRQGQGRLVLSGGTVWEGAIDRGGPGGVGRLVPVHGRTYEGVMHGRHPGVGAWIYPSGDAALPLTACELHVAADGRLTLRLQADDVHYALPAAGPPGAALATALLRCMRRGERPALGLDILADHRVGLRASGLGTAHFLALDQAAADLRLRDRLRGLSMATLVAKRAALGRRPAATLEAFKLAAWRPDVPLLEALEAVHQRVAATAAHGPATAALVRALIMLHGPALAFATQPAEGPPEAYPTLHAYPSQLAFVSDVLLDASHYLEVVLDAGRGPRPPTTLLFHVESFPARAPALRHIVRSLADGLALAHRTDVALGAGAAPTVDALLAGIGGRGACLDGRVSAMQETLVELGLADDAAERVPDLTGKDVLAQCSEHVRVFQLQQLRAFAADRQVPPARALILGHPDFLAHYFTEARFCAYLRGTATGAALDAAAFAAAVRHQVDVLGIL